MKKFGLEKGAETKWSTAMSLRLRNLCMATAQSQRRGANWLIDVGLSKSSDGKDSFADAKAKQKASFGKDAGDEDEEEDESEDNEEDGDEGRVSCAQRSDLTRERRETRDVKSEERTIQELLMKSCPHESRLLEPLNQSAVFGRAFS